MEAPVTVIDGKVLLQSITEIQGNRLMIDPDGTGDWSGRN